MKTNKIFSRFHFSFKYNKLLFSWIMTYVIVLTIPVVSNIFIYKTAETAVIEEVIQYNKGALEKMQRYVDSLLAANANIIPSISANPNVKNLMASIPSPDNKSNSFYFIDLSYDLKSHLTFNNDFTDIYVYFFEMDYAVSSSYSNPGKEFFDYFYQGSGWDYSDWFSAITNGVYSDYKVVVLDDGNRYIDLIYHLPNNSMGYSGMAIVLRTEESKLLENTDMLNDEIRDIIIIDHDNNIVLSTNKSKENALPSYASFDLDESLKKFDKETMIYSVSNYNKWLYISILPNSVFWQELRFVRVGNTVNLIISLLLCYFLGYYFALKNYKPIDRLIKKTKELYSSKELFSKNEYEILEGALNDYAYSRRTIHSIKWQNHLNEKNKFFERLLKFSTAEAQRRLPTWFETISEYFVVLIFITHGSENFFAEESDITDEEKDSLLFFIMQNVLEELLNIDTRGYVFKIDGQIAALLNLDNDNVLSWQNNLKEKLETTKKFVEDNYNFSFYVYVSTPCSELFTLNSAYNEVINSLKYNTATNNGKPNFYNSSEDKNRFDGILLHTLLEKERQLIRFMNIGDYDSCKYIVTKLIENHINDSDVLTANTFTLVLTGSILHSIFNDENESTNANIGTNFSAKVTQLLMFTSIDDFLDKFLKLLSKLCDYKKSELERKASSELMDLDVDAESIALQIKEYIDENYKDSSLNIASIGDRMHITPYYASRLFKKIEGQSMLDYIGAVRVSKSKELFRTTDNSIEQVAVLTGFNSTKTFVRTFVKHEHITPGKYKKMLTDEI